MRIRGKLLISAFVAVVFGSTVANIVAYRHFRVVLRSEIIQEQRYQLATVTRNLERVLSDLKRVGEGLVVEPEIQRFLRATQRGVEAPGDRVLAVRATMNHLVYLLTLQDFIESATLIDTQGNEYWSVYPVELFAADAPVKPTSAVWPVGQPAQFLGPYGIVERGEEHPYIGYFIQVYDVDNPRSRTGSMVLHMRLHTLRTILDADLAGMDSVEVSLAGELIWRSPSAAWTDDGEPFRIVSRSQSPAGVELRARVTERSIARSLRPVGLTFAGITFLAIVIYLILLIPLLWHILLPVNELYQAVQRASAGNYDEGPQVTSGDELQVLADQFNHMLEQIKEHIAAEVSAERKVRRMEYDLLVAQINPHFLYNALNSVKFLAHLKRGEALDEVVDALIDILHRTVGEPGTLVTTTVGMELELVRQYVLIQKHQYRDLFSVTYSVDPRLEPCIIPGFLIQPLVENAIFHGIRPANRNGTIEVSIAAHADRLRIRVADDGVGADPEHLHRTIDAGATMKSIGIANIRSRLAFHYPDQHLFSLHTQPGEGFLVVIEIPCT